MVDPSEARTEMKKIRSGVGGVIRAALSMGNGFGLPRLGLVEPMWILWLVLNQ